MINPVGPKNHFFSPHNVVYQVQTFFHQVVMDMFERIAEDRAEDVARQNALHVKRERGSLPSWKQRRTDVQFTFDHYLSKVMQHALNP